MNTVRRYSTRLLYRTTDGLSVMYRRYFVAFAGVDSKGRPRAERMCVCVCVCVCDKCFYYDQHAAC